MIDELPPLATFVLLAPFAYLSYLAQTNLAILLVFWSLWPLSVIALFAVQRGNLAASY